MFYSSQFHVLSALGLMSTNVSHSHGAWVKRNRHPTNSAGPTYQAFSGLNNPSAQGFLKGSLISKYVVPQILGTMEP